MRPPRHCQETQRLEALKGYQILDTPDEQAYDDITRIAAHVCQAPIAVVNFVDAERQWFKSTVGIPIRQTPLENSICAHAILETDLMVVPDTLEDFRFAENPLVKGPPHLRFYAGALLRSSEGFPLGTLCVLDYQPRDLTDEQRNALLALSRQVMTQLELRARTQEVAVLNDRLHQAVYESSHRLKNHLQILAGTVDMTTMGNRASIPAEEVERLGAQVRALSVIHDILTADTKAHIDGQSMSSRSLLERLLTILGQTSGGHCITFTVDDIPLPLRLVTSLALGVNELVSNGIKHGRSQLDVSLTVRDGVCTLQVCDDGPGFPPDFDAMAASNTGMELLELTRMDMHGQVCYGNLPGGGACVTLTFPQPESD